MYEQFKNEILAAIDHMVSADTLARIAGEMDKAATHYTITKAETALAVVGQAEHERLIKTYLVVKRMEGLRPATLARYAQVLRGLMHAIGKAPDEVTANDLRLYLWRYQEQRGVSMRTLDSVRMAICTFYAWAAREGYIQRNPGDGVQKIRYETKPRKALTQIELEMMRRACRTERERAMVETLYSTGCRVSELIGIRLSDVDMERGTVHLLGKGQKHRTSYLNAKATVAIRRYLATRRRESEYLIGRERGEGGIGKENAEKIIRQIAGRAGLGDRDVTPHVLRHTMATQAMACGMPVQDIQQILGHAQISTTMIYARTTQESVRQGHIRSVV